MIKCIDKNGAYVWVALLPDCENENDLYCTVYTDDTMNWEIDNFVIHDFDWMELRPIVEYVKNNIESPVKYRNKSYIANELERLVHNRFNSKTLLAKLADIFGEPVSLHHSDCEADELLGDYCWSFCIGEDFGVFDIHYLPCRCTDENGNNLYITEVGFSFGC